MKRWLRCTATACCLTLLFSLFASCDSNGGKHRHLEIVDQAVEATCTEDGKTEGKHCAVCKEILVQQQVVPAKGHTEVVDQAVEATCTTPGKTEGKHCSVCNTVIVKQEIVPAKGHSYGDWQSDEINHWKTCLICEESDEKGSHAWDKGVITKPATESETGEKTYTCTVCKTTKKEVIPELIHTHTYSDEWTTDVEATCTKPGSKSRHCTSCGEKTDITEIPTIAHTEVTDAAIAATCLKSGKTEGKHCSVCNTVIVKQEVVPAKGHSYGDWQFNETKHWKECKNGCGTKIDESLHTRNEQNKCSVCNKEMGDQLLPYEEDKKLYSYRPQITNEMPAVYINTTSGSNSWATDLNQQSKLNNQIEYNEATISVKNCEEKYAMENVAGSVKVRGNYTLNYAKKSLRIKFDKKQAMLGLNNGAKCKSWVLLADWKDLGMSNNTTALYFGKTVLGSDGYYSTDYRNVEVYLNGQYWGVYLLVEQQQINKNRVDIAEAEDGYTGTDIGYLIEYDGYYDQEDVNNGGDYTFTMNYNAWQKGYTLKCDIYSQAQVNFIRNYMNNVYKIVTEALNGRYYKFNASYTGLETASGTYTNAQETIGAVLDVQSLADSYIIQEIACDPDIAWSSFYMDVDMSAEGDKKLRFEAPWDFDSAFGIREGYCNNAQELYAAKSNNPWLNLLVNQSWFTAKVKEKWQKLADYGVLKTSLELVQEQKTMYQSYYARNNIRWQSRLNEGNGELVGTLNSYKDAATAQGLASDYHYNWLYKRLNYLNKVWGDGADVLTGKKPEDAKTDETVSGDKYRFEAENGEVTGGITVRTGNQYNTSGTGYLGNVSGGAVTIPEQTVEGIGVGEEEWHTFISVKVAPVTLRKGQNTIVFTTGNESTNFDCFDLYSTVKLS